MHLNTKLKSLKIKNIYIKKNNLSLFFEKKQLKIIMETLNKLFFFTDNKIFSENKEIVY